MKKILFMLLFFYTLSYSQKTESNFNTHISKEIILINKKGVKIDSVLLKSWQHKDIVADTIPGVSTEKAYEEILSKKPGKSVIVAVIDGGTDIDHEDLKNQIWINPKEIPNNKIDDDNNGYVDDINGWNFLGNRKGKNVYYTRWEFVRILHQKGYFTKGELNVPNGEKDSLILNAVKFYKEAKSVLEEDKAYVLDIKEKFALIKKGLKDYFPNQEYNLEKLKSIDTVKNKKLRKAVKTLYSFLKYDLTEEWLNDYEKIYVDIIENYKLNPDYNERKLIGDKVNDITDIKYGNNNVVGDTNKENHGTLVSGIIGAIRNNNLGINGIADNVKLMLLRAIPKGDEYDKDVALAIRYAVDNGAKVINMSFGKFFSQHSNFVRDAIKYASEKDVILINSAGNDGKNIDMYDCYPVDYVVNKEYANNFITVGALNTSLDKTLPAYFSNYGKKNVDVFAPGVNIYTTSTNNTYKNVDGTSFAAPIVAGVAAVLRSRYPKLKASQVKKIILESGNTYHIKVNYPGQDDQLVIPFSDLSKSGKIVNAYNALLLAEQISKNQ